MKKIAIAAGIFFLPYASLAAGFDRDLSFGMLQDSDVTRLQEFLRAQGMYQGPTTGNFFGLTRDAIKKFQEREGIAPAAGYVGVKTRARLNALSQTGSPPGSAASREEKISRLMLLIQALQDQLKNLLAVQAGETASSTPSVFAPAPSFTKLPKLVSGEFVENSPYGARYPYRVMFDWATDAAGTFGESLICAPVLQSSGVGARSAAYFPESGTNYACSAEVKTAAGGKASANISFQSPRWISVAGRHTASFPDRDVTPLKLGEMTVYNGTTSDILFSNFEVMVSDGMDSTFNRGRKVTFILRDGINAEDPLISKTDFTFVSAPPALGSPYRAPVTFPFAVLIPAAGQEKKISLWVEQFKYVTSGTLEISSTKIVTALTDTVRGSFKFILTKAPGL